MKGSATDRYGHLEKCLDNLNKSLWDKPGSCRELGKAFPDLYRDNRAALQAISDEFGEKFRNHLRQSTDQLLEDHALKNKLQKLDELPNATLEGWRPSGDPEKDMTAHIALQKQNERLKIQAEITKEDDEIERLQKVLSQKQNEFKERMIRVTSLNEDIVAAGKIAFSAQDIVKPNEQ